MINENNSVQQTIHSQIEEQNDRISFLETIVNRFKTQIIFTENFSQEFENILGNRRINLSPKLTKEELVNKLKTYLTGSKVAIYTQISDHEFYKIQQILINEFPTIKFLKCSYFAQDVESEEQLINILSIQHKEQGHPGMLAFYEDIKFKIYYKNIKLTINKITNNCEICCRAKYDRNPIRPKFQKTELPTDKNQIIHIDTYVNKKQTFLIFIDKFTKFATTYPLENRNHVEIIEKLKMYFNHKKPLKIIADNEFKHINIKEFLNKENVELHLVKSNSHTGNSDVERLNNSLTEKLRILNLEQTQPVRIQMLDAVKTYNNQYHSTIKCAPIKAEEGIQSREETHNNLIVAQGKRLDKYNKNREDYKENRQYGYIKNYKALRHKDQPKFRKHKLDNIHPINIKRPLKFTDYDDNIIPNTDDDDTNTCPTPSGESRN